MGCHPNITHDKFPRQGSFYQSRVKVMFNYSEPLFVGQIVRDDAEEPFVSIIKLDDGRYVLTTECQYQPIAPVQAVMTQEGGR